MVDDILQIVTSETAKTNESLREKIVGFFNNFYSVDNRYSENLKEGNETALKIYSYGLIEEALQQYQ